jgi:ketopantoate reductase
MEMKMYKNRKYITINRNDGTDFRTIARRMTECGFRMNHATARNILFFSLESFVKNLCVNLGVETTDEAVKKIIFSQEMHNMFSDVIAKSYIEMKKDEIYNG